MFIFLNQFTDDLNLFFNVSSNVSLYLKATKIILSSAKLEFKNHNYLILLASWNILKRIRPRMAPSVTSEIRI